MLVLFVYYHQTFYQNYKYKDVTIPEDNPIKYSNYKEIIDIVKNAISSFLGGGVICLIGQIIFYIFNSVLEKNNEDSTALTIGIMILIAGVLSALGIYDKIGQYFKCGSVVPITGFANSIVAPSIEYKSEGYIMGVGGKMFTVAGPVLVFGISASIIVGLIYLIFNTQSITLV